MGMVWNIGKKAPGRIARAVLDFALPARCVICTEPVTVHNALCAPCWSKLNFIEAPRCEVYGSPLPYASDEPSLSAAAARQLPDWNRARAAVSFDDHSRRLVHALKYYDRHEVVRLMAQQMGRCGTDILQDADLLIPVPLHWGRMWSRRFNQAALLAQRMCAGLPGRYRPDLLKRRRATRSQVGLSGRARHENVKGAFTVPKELKCDLVDRNIVLIDDVLTTGATVEACARVLKAAGAARVDVLVFALVLNAERSHV